MPKQILWEGSFFANHSLALVNRELVVRLASESDLDLCIRSGETGMTSWGGDVQAQLKAREVRSPEPPLDVTVRHEFPMSARPPRSGAWVIMQPWEYGAVPRAWLDVMRFAADEVWVPSSFNAECCIESGIPEGKIRVVPNGAQQVMFTPPSVYPLRTRKRFRFLFVGGTIMRKGIDLLVDAYTRAFTPEDDVCLVIKDFGVGTYYKHQTYDGFLRELEADESVPEIEYLNEDLAPERLRDLYASCDCLVHPYRGEGFGMPIAEAMACGLPVIVTDGGGARDFCTRETARLIPARRELVPPSWRPGMDTVQPAWWLEPDGGALREMMREAYEAPESLREMARRGQALVTTRFTWDRSAAAAAEGLRSVAGGEVARLDATRQHGGRMEAGIGAWTLGQPLEALRHFAVARHWEASDDALHNLAAVLAARGDHHSAVSILDQLRDRALDGGSILDRDLASSTLSLTAHCQLALGRRAEATCAIETAARLGLDNDDFRALHDHLAIPEATPASPAPALPRVRWHAPVFNSSGYADEVRNFVLGLHDLGWNVDLVPSDQPVDNGILARSEYETLLALTRSRQSGIDVELQHLAANMALAPLKGTAIIRTMFETDRLTSAWVDVCNRFREVWVPAEFNRETFARAGVVEEKIRVLPESLDTRLYDAARHRPMNLQRARSFRFLSVFDWTPRKGWDVLLRAYLEEFSPDEDVSLVIKATNFHNEMAPAEFVKGYLEEHGWHRPPHIEVIDRHLTTSELISLYLAGNAFVLPSRGEGWGRPYMEAMSLGIPVIGTRWSGNLAFMDDESSYLIEIDGLEPADRQGWEHYRGHLWASPSVESTREQMRSVFTDRDEAAIRAARGRARIRANYSREAVAKLLAAELERVAE